MTSTRLDTIEEILSIARDLDLDSREIDNTAIEIFAPQSHPRPDSSLRSLSRMLVDAGVSFSDNWSWYRMRWDRIVLSRPLDVADVAPKSSTILDPQDFERYNLNRLYLIRKAIELNLEVSTKRDKLVISKSWTNLAQVRGFKEMTIYLTCHNLEYSVRDMEKTCQLIISTSNLHSVNLDPLVEDSGASVSLEEVKAAATSFGLVYLIALNTPVEEYSIFTGYIGKFEFVDFLTANKVQFKNNSSDPFTVLIYVKNACLRAKSDVSQSESAGVIPPFTGLTSREHVKNMIVGLAENLGFRVNFEEGNFDVIIPIIGEPARYDFFILYLDTHKINYEWRGPVRNVIRIFLVSFDSQTKPLTVTHDDTGKMQIWFNKDNSGYDDEILRQVESKYGPTYYRPIRWTIRGDTHLAFEFAS